jgi:hypothetical protein
MSHSNILVDGRIEFDIEIVQLGCLHPFFNSLVALASLK